MARNYVEHRQAAEAKGSSLTVWDVRAGDLSPIIAALAATRGPNP